MSTSSSAGPARRGEAPCSGRPADHEGHGPTRASCARSATTPTTPRSPRRPIAMAHSMGLTVVAESVETEKQLDFLRERACDECQGLLSSSRSRCRRRRSPSALRRSAGAGARWARSSHAGRDVPERCEPGRVRSEAPPQRCRSGGEPVGPITDSRRDLRTWRPDRWSSRGSRGCRSRPRRHLYRSTAGPAPPRRPLA